MEWDGLREVSNGRVEWDGSENREVGNGRVELDWLREERLWMGG